MFVCATCSSAIEWSNQRLSCRHCAIRLRWADVYRSALEKVFASNRVDAQDLVHDVMLELLCPRSDGQPRTLRLESLPAFIACIARRRHIDHLRRSRRIEYRDDIEAITEDESIWRYLAHGRDHERNGLCAQLQVALTALAETADGVGAIARLLLEDPDFEPSVRRLATYFGWSHHRTYATSLRFLRAVRARLANAS